MGIPLAVSPSTKTPGLALAVDLLAGASSPGSGALRALIMAPKSSSGTITPDTQLVQGVAGPEDVAALLGAGTPGHLAAVALFRAKGDALVDVMAPTASAGATATSTILMAGSPTAARTIRITIKGVQIDVPWLASETATQAADKVTLFVNGATSQVPVIASNVAGLVTFTAKIAGPWANDVIISAQLVDGAGGTATSSGNLGSLVAGTTEPDFSSALTTAASVEYDYIVPCLSNADWQNTGAGNAQDVLDHLNSNDTGFNAKLQQAVCGLTGALSTAKAGAQDRNSEVMEYIFCMVGQSLGCEFAGYEAGDRMRRRSLDSAANRIGTKLTGLVGAVDLINDKPTPVEVEDALNNGVSIVDYTASGDPFVTRPITTHSNSGTDFRALDVSGIDAVFDVAKDLRSAIPQQFPFAKLSPDLPAGAEPVPPGVVEVKEIKAFVLSRLKFWAQLGVVRPDKLAESVANNTFIVRVNPSDPTQCDMVVPLFIFPPLAKFSVYVQKLSA